MRTTANSVKLTARATSLLVLLLGGGLLARWLAAVAATVAQHVGAGLPVRPDEVLLATVAACAAALLAWLTLGTALELLSIVPGAMGDAARTASAVVTPRLVRRLVGLGLGAGVVAGLAPGACLAGPPPGRTVAVAAPLPDPAFTALPDPGWAPPATPAPPPPAVLRAPPDVGWLPTAPAVRPQADVRLLGHRPTGDAEVVVRRGDSLWSIAARSLGEGASDSQIALAWPRWHEANRDVVGDDPDLLRPGQVLRAPGVAS